MEASNLTIHGYSKYLLSAALIGVSPVFAVDQYFDTNGATAGSGNANGTWDAATTSAWSTNSAGTVATGLWGGAANTAIFAAGTDFTGTRIVTVSGTVGLTGFTVENEVTNLTLTGGTLDFGAAQGVINTTAWGTTSAKTLNVNSLLTGTNGLLINSNGDLSASGGGNSSITKLGNVANTFTGNVTITSGLVAYAHNDSFGNAANQIILNGGGLLDNNLNIALSRNIQVLAGGGTFRTYGATNVTWTSAITGSGNINRTDGGTLVLAGDLSGYSGTYNNQSGTTTISGATTFGGNATVSGGTFTFAGGAIAGNVNVNGGTLTLNYATNSASKLNGTNTITLAGGTLSLAGGSTVDTGAASTILSAGTASTISQASGTSVLALGSLTRNARASLNIGTSGIVTTSTGSASTVLTDATTGGAFATVGGNDWAAKDAGNSAIVGLSTIGGYTAVNDTTNPVLFTGNTDLTNAVAGTYTLSGNSAPTTIRNTTITGNTIALAGNTLSTSGILSNTAALTISGAGSLTAATPGGELVLMQTGGTTSISANISNNTSASSLTKTGTGTVGLTGTQSYTGVTNVTQGTLLLGSTSLGGGAAVMSTSGFVVSTGATLNLGAGTLSASQNITGGGNFNKGGNFITNGTVNGTANTYTGTTGVTVGSLTFGAGSVVNGTSSISVAASNNAVIVNNGSITTPGTVTINGGNSTAAGLFTNGNVAGTTPGVLNAATLTLGTANGQTSGTAHGGAYTNNLNSTTNITGAITVGGEGSATAAIPVSAAGSLFTMSGGTVSAASLALSNSAATNTVSNKGGVFTQTAGTTTLTGALSLASAGTTANPYAIGAAGNDTAFNLSGGTFSSGSASLNGLTTISGTGTLNVAGNFYMGDTGQGRIGTVTQSGGTVNLATVGADTIRVGHWGDETSTYNISGGTLNATGVDAVVGWDGNGVVNVSGGIANLRGIRMGNTQTAGTHNGAGTLTLTGGGRLNLGAGGISSAGTGLKTVSLGAGTMGAFANWASSQSMALTDNATGVTFNTLDSVDGTTARTITLSGVLSSTGALNKAGAGTLILSGTNTYGGSTNVNGGTLLFNGNSSAVVGLATVAGGATMGGTGSFGGALNVTGTLAPGASIESLATGAVTLNAASTFAYELNSGVLNGDLLVVNGGLSIDNLALLNITELVSGSLSLGSKLTLINYSGAWNGGTFSGIADDSTVVVGSNAWQINYNDISGGSNFAGEQTGGNFLTMTVVPEPSVALLGGLSLLGLLRRKRN